MTVILYADNKENVAQASDQSVWVRQGIAFLGGMLSFVVGFAFGFIAGVIVLWGRL